MFSPEGKVIIISLGIRGLSGNASIAGIILAKIWASRPCFRRFREFLLILFPQLRKSLFTAYQYNAVLPILFLFTAAMFFRPWLKKKEWAIDEEFTPPSLCYVPLWIFYFLNSHEYDNNY